MHCLRRYRLHLVIMACAHLLFMQLALAQYICPGMGTAMAMPMPQQMEGSALIECPQAAHGDRAALCMAHCQASGLSSHVSVIPAIAPPSLNAWDSPWVHALTPASATTAWPRSPHRASAPPMSIRHCCMRI